MLRLTEKQRCRYALRKILKELPTDRDDHYPHHLASSYRHMAHAWTILPFCGFDHYTPSELSLVSIDTERRCLVELNADLHEYLRIVQQNRTDTLELRNAQRLNPQSLPLRLYLSDLERRPIDVSTYLINTGSLIQRSHALFRGEDGHFFGRMGWYVYRDIANLTDGLVALLENRDRNGGPMT